MRLSGYSRIAATLAGVVIISAAASWTTFARKDTSSVPPLHFARYEPQKVVYHVTTGGGWFSHEHHHLLTVLQNHMNAVGAGFLDMQVVLQGDGLDLLIAARRDARLAGSIDRLKRQGAHFVVCYNTLVSRRLDPDRDLYGVTRADIVAAGVAEVTRLSGKGFAYLRI